MEHDDLEKPTTFLGLYLRCTQREDKPKKKKPRRRIQKHVPNRESLQEQLTSYPGSKKSCAHARAWSYDMEGDAEKCVERYCESAKNNIEQLYKVSAPCLDDHQFRQEELETVRELSKVRLETCLYLVCIDRPDILWSVKKLA